MRFLGSIVFYFVWLSLLNCRVVGEARFFPKLGFQKVCSVRRSKITATFLHFQILHVSTSEIELVLLVMSESAVMSSQRNGTHSVSHWMDIWASAVTAE